MLDTNFLSVLYSERHRDHSSAMALLKRLTSRPDTQVTIPSIVVYEAERELVRLAKKDNRGNETRALRRLRDLADALGILRLENQHLRRAAELWADALLSGRQTAASHRLDQDVIIGAQANETGAVVITSNLKHLQHYCAVARWQDL